MGETHDDVLTYAARFEGVVDVCSGNEGSRCAFKLVFDVVGHDERELLSEDGVCEGCSRRRRKKQESDNHRMKMREREVSISSDDRGESDIAWGETMLSSNGPRYELRVRRMFPDQQGGGGRLEFNVQRPRFPRICPSIY